MAMAARSSQGKRVYIIDRSVVGDKSDMRIIKFLGEAYQHLRDRSDGGRSGGAAWNARRPGGAAGAAAAAARGRRSCAVRRPRLAAPTCSAAAARSTTAGPTATPSTTGATEGPTLSGGALARPDIQARAVTGRPSIV